MQDSITATPGRPVPKVALALCATFTVGAAHAAPIVVDVAPDVTLGTFQIDFDGNGSNELSFSRNAFEGLFQNSVTTLGANTGVVGYVVDSGVKPGTYAEALAGGSTIDASLDYVSGTDLILSGKVATSYGEFLDNGLAYLGVRFDIAGVAHFGWVELVGEDGSITITRYGYEDEARAPIVAGADGETVPEPGSLALLAAGAAGVLALRRRRKPA